MKNLKLILGSVILASAAIFIFVTQSTKTDSEATIVGPKPTVEAATKINNAESNNDSTNGRVSVGQSPINTLFNNKVNTFNIDYATVIYIGSKSQTEKNAIFLDATIDASMHIGIANTKKNKTLVIAQLDGTALSLGNDEGLMIDLEQLRAAEETLTLPFAFEYDKHGIVSKIYLSNDEDEFSSGVKRSIAGRMQFYLGPIKADMTQTESNEFGLYTANYQKNKKGGFNKKINEFTELARSGGAQPSHKIVSQDYFGVYQTSINGRLDFLSATSSVETKADALSFVADTELSMNWIAFSDRQFSEQLINGFHVSSLHHLNASNRTAQSSKNLDPKDEINSKEFITNIKSFIKNGDDDSAWAQRDIFIQSIIQNPDNLAGITELFDQGIGEEEGAYLLGALTDAETPQAQKALTSLASNPKLSSDTRSQAVSHMTLLTKPTDETVGFLSDLVSNQKVDAFVRDTAVLALGGVLNTANPDGANEFQVNKEKIEFATNQLIDGLETAESYEDKSLYLQGLGNAGLSTTENRLMQIAASDDESMRAAAVDSLRFVEGENVDNMVVSMISGDPDQDVRVSAIRSTIYREENENIDLALMNTITGSTNEEEKIEALSAMDFRAGENNEFQSQVEHLAANDKSEKVREYANDIYQKRLKDEQLANGTSIEVYQDEMLEGSQEGQQEDHQSDFQEEL